MQLVFAAAMTPTVPPSSSAKRRLVGLDVMRGITMEQTLVKLASTKKDSPHSN